MENGVKKFILFMTSSNSIGKKNAEEMVCQNGCVYRNHKIFIRKKLKKEIKTGWNWINLPYFQIEKNFHPLFTFLLYQFHRRFYTFFIIFRSQFFHSFTRNLSVKSSNVFVEKSPENVAVENQFWWNVGRNDWWMFYCRSILWGINMKIK